MSVHQRQLAQLSTNHKWQFAFAAMVVFAVCAAKGSERFPFAVSYGGETNATSVAHFLTRLPASTVSCAWREASS